MGTRNLTMVISNGETKVAQYGQWDGYPSGQGATALRFLREVNIERFKEKLKSLHWLTNEEIEKIESVGDWTTHHPYLSRDRGADILNIIMYSKYEESHKEKTFSGNIVGLVDQSDFAADSLLNEWTYVIDLDKETFEVYSGFNKSPLTESDRFYHLEEKKQGGFYPVKIVKSFSLLNIPTEDEFIAELEGKNED